MQITKSKYRKLNDLVPALAVMLLLSACGADATPTAIPPASTPTSTVAQSTPTTAEATPTREATPTEVDMATAVTTQAVVGPACAGIALSSVRLDTMALPYPWQPNCVAATPYNNSQPPGPSGMPQHIEVNFGSVDGKNVQPGDPIIYIIPVAEYKKMWDDANDPAVS